MLDGEERRVLLMDFGIAKALAPDAAAARTQTGVVVGTPHYMSPEQASGERQLDARSDLYSLGVVAYQMLAGEVPFTGATVAAILMKQVGDEAPPVTRRRPDCPADLAAAVQRCLAKAPEARWASADDLVRALTAADAPPTVELRRSGARAARGIPEPLHRFRIAVLTALAVVAAGAGMDLTLGRVLAGPFAFIVGAFIVAAEYGKLWTAGYGWRDALRWGLGAPDRTPVPLDSAEFGPHYVVVQQGRNDRAAILAVVARGPKAERQILGDVMPTVDAAVARVADIARQLFAVERQIEPGPEEIERRLAATRAEPPSPGRDQRLLVLERRREAVRGLGERRRRIAAHLEAAVAAIGRVRLTLEQAQGEGVRPALQRIHEALAALDARATETPTA